MPQAQRTSNPFFWEHISRKKTLLSLSVSSLPRHGWGCKKLAKSPETLGEIKNNTHPKTGVRVVHFKGFLQKLAMLIQTVLPLRQHQIPS